VFAVACALACADDHDLHGPLPGPDPGSRGLQGKGGAIPGVERAPRLIEITASEYDFSPSQLRVEPGEQIVLALRNQGTMPHGIVVEIDGVRFGEDEDVPPGEVLTLPLTIPSEPGTHEYYSPMTDMRELGMNGRLLVLRPPAVRLTPIAEGLVSPIALVTAPGDTSHRRFIADQVGVVRILTERDELLPEPFLDLRDRIVALDPAYDERGLLGLAFHPQYASNGRFFVHYSAPRRPGAAAFADHTSTVSEFTAPWPASNHVPLESERVILVLDQPQANHNGGTLAFGPDDLLYVAFGDGGGEGDRGPGHDPQLGNAQDTRSWFGSVLRVDVDPPPAAQRAFRAPDDNPFALGGGAAEIFAYGFRNPFGLSFDRGGTQALMVPDAGQYHWEEVNRIEEAGGNYGWNVREGTHCFDADLLEPPLQTCADVGPSGEPLIPPVIEFPNAAQPGGFGAAVIGGHVYRGNAIPELSGRYVFGTFGRSSTEPDALLLVASDHDHTRADLWGVERIAPVGQGKYYVEHFLKGIGQDELGELYLLVSDEPGPAGESGRVIRVQANPD
jgi:glucose/arabinose dehydrogenase/plastocyanin